MVEAADLRSGEVYYLARLGGVVAHQYVGGLGESAGRQPVYFFADEFRRPLRVYGPDLLGYYATEGSAREALVAHLEEMLRVERALLGVPSEEVNQSVNQSAGVPA